MSKSYVTMEQKVCLICRLTFETNCILLDTRMQERFEAHTITGTGQCDECIGMNNKGYVALVGANGPRDGGDTLEPEDAVYTEEYLWLQRYVAEQIIDTDLTDWPFVYIEPDAIEKIKRVVAANQADESEHGKH